MFARDHFGNLKINAENGAMLGAISNTALMTAISLETSIRGTCQPSFLTGVIYIGLTTGLFALCGSVMENIIDSDNEYFSSPTRRC